MKSEIGWGVPEIAFPQVSGGGICAGRRRFTRFGWSSHTPGGTYDTVRHAEMYRVWFTCNRCHAVFKQ